MSTFSTLFSSLQAIMARREFINFPASQLMTDFEIIHLGQDIIQYNEANQNQDDVIILPIQDLQIMEETRG